MGLELIEGGKERKIGDKVRRHMQKLGGLNIYDKVYFTDEDGSTQVAVIGYTPSQILNDPNGEVEISLGGDVIKKISISTITRVVERYQDMVVAARSISSSIRGRAGETLASGLPVHRNGNVLMTDFGK